MFQSLLNAWRLPDLRKRLLFTAFIIAMYRLGSFIPVPGIDLAAIKEPVCRRRRLRLLQPVRRAAPSTEWRCSRWASCPTSRRRSSCSCSGWSSRNCRRLPGKVRPAPRR